MRVPTYKQIKLSEIRRHMHLVPFKVYFYLAVYFFFFRFLKKGRNKLRKGGSGIGKVEGRKGSVDFVSNLTVRRLLNTFP